LQAVHCRRGGSVFGEFPQHQQFLCLIAVQICHVKHGIRGSEQLLHFAVAVVVDSQGFVRLVYAAVAHEDLILGIFAAHGRDDDAFHFRAVCRTVADRHPLPLHLIQYTEPQTVFHGGKAGFLIEHQRFVLAVVVQIDYRKGRQIGSGSGVLQGDAAAHCVL